MIKIIKTEVKSLSEFRKFVFDEINNIIENNLNDTGFSSYEITGSQKVSTFFSPSIKLILHYEDRIRSFKFKYLNESIEMVSVTLYKKDFIKTSL